MAENISNKMKGQKRFTFNQFLKNLYQILSQRRELVLFILLTVVSAVLQVYFAMRTWGMIHSDEIFQSLEIAHNLVFGYANIPPEFQAYHHYSPYYAQCRSHLFPLIFSIPMYLGKIFGWSYWRVTIPLIRFFLGINGALLTPSTYLLVKQFTCGKTRYAFASAFLITFSPLLMFLSFRSLTNIFFIPWIFFLVTLYWKDVNKLKEIKNVKEISEGFSFQALNIYLRISLYTLLIGLILYIRMDLIIPLFAILVFRFPFRKIKVLISHVSGLILALVLGGVVDFHYYGKFLVSPINWFKFNILEGKSTIFGEEPFSFYFAQIVNYLPILLIVCYCIFFLLVLISSNLWRYKKEGEVRWDRVRILSSYLLSSFIIIIFFSLLKHKEIRFVYSGYIFLHIVIAITFVLTLESIIPKINSFISRLFTKRERSLSTNTRRFLSLFYFTFFLTIIIVSTAISTYQAMQIVDWKEADVISKGLAFVGQSEDSTGVIVIIRSFLGDYYCYLHKNISIIAFRHLGTYDSIYTFALYTKEISYHYNYVIVPYYQIEKTPEIISILEENAYVSVQEMNGQGYIYKYIPSEIEP
ncbi:MAG: hypothetical protein HGN29_08580 [Asgard group archaeon]|nr:hypothetical protein [Asgard group archaeon]